MSVGSQPTGTAFLTLVKTQPLLFYTLVMTSIFWLSQADFKFPPVEHALVEPNGLLAAGGDLSESRLFSAYQNGIFPWYEPNDTILWWSPNPRAVIFPEQIYTSKRLQREINQQSYKITFDKAFNKVIKACAEIPRAQEGCWLGDEMIEAFCQMHLAMQAHSIEVWEDENLIGGLYGVAVNGVFSGESMFSLKPNASKIAMVHLCQALKSWGYQLLDCQVMNPHLASMGAIEIPRPIFIDILIKPASISKLAWLAH